MTRLSAYFFGGFHLYMGERPLGSFATRKSKTLLAFLMLHSGQLFPREALAYTVWGEQLEADPARPSGRSSGPFAVPSRRAARSPTHF